MRALLLVLTAVACQAQTGLTYHSHTTENLRGASAVSRTIAWASGTHGTYLRTTDGRRWTPGQIAGAESLDFRAVVAFSADEAFLMSAGPGDQSRIYHTRDGGQHWKLQFTNTNPKGFFDSMVFWDSTHGLVLGDPIPDETGKLKFELLATNDSENWSPLPSAQLPPAMEGEGAFAASNSCIAILPDRTAWLKSGGSPPPDQSSKKQESSEATDPNIWFATGGKTARVFHSSDRGATWQVFDTPILHGADSTGIFSIAFRDPLHGVIAGGDYKHPDQDGPDLAFTNDGGKTWSLSSIKPQAYFSAVAYDRGGQNSLRQESQEKGNNTKSRIPNENQIHSRLFIVGPKFIFDFRPPADPTRISPTKKWVVEFNAVSAYPEGGALVVGPKGSVTTIP
jgi:photosystem II stability/assembly factor-like uncharacterized protein